MPSSKSHAPAADPQPTHPDPANAPTPSPSRTTHANIDSIRCRRSLPLQSKGVQGKQVSSKGVSRKGVPRKRKVTLWQTQSDSAHETPPHSCTTRSRRPTSPPTLPARKQRTFSCNNAQRSSVRARVHTNTWHSRLQLQNLECGTQRSARSTPAAMPTSFSTKGLRRRTKPPPRPRHTPLTCRSSMWKQQTTSRQRFRAPVNSKMSWAISQLMATQLTLIRHPPASPGMRGRHRKQLKIQHQRKPPQQRRKRAMSRRGKNLHPRMVLSPFNTTAPYLALQICST